jgi:DNA mismatch repair ATPase MutS
LGELYSQQHGVTIRVTFNAARGYYLLVPATLDPLPSSFLQGVANKRSVSCSTEEMNRLSDRATEAITQALTLTHELTQELLGEVRTRMQCLFSVTDSVVSDL